MNKKRKMYMKKTKIGFAIIFIICIVVAILVINNKQNLQKVFEFSKREEIKKEITYNIYSFVDNKLTVSLKAEDTENGIEELVYPDSEMTIKCSGKKKVWIDYQIDTSNDKQYTFIAKNSLGEQITCTININDDYRQFLSNLIPYTVTVQNGTQVTINAEYATENIVSKQYKIGANSSIWTNYTNSLTIDSYQLYKQLGIKDGMVEVSLRQVDNLGYEIITKNVISIGVIEYKEEDTKIQGESILSCVEDNALVSGNYIFEVNGQTYPVELYNYNGDTKYASNISTTIDTAQFNGIGDNTTDSRMLILKYNGNITIQENTILTPSVRKKGMLIYASGTIENSGTISMTARGASAVGQDVYLYKNSDNVYEYVPATGATGTSRASGRVGYTGNAATGRQTGSGGSGGGRTYWYAGVGGAGRSWDIILWRSRTVVEE